MSEKGDLFDELRALIITGDQKNLSDANLLEKIDQLEKDISDPQKFNRKLKDNRENLVNLLGPAMGKLIKSFVASEMAKVNQSIQDKKIRFFTIFKPKKRLRTLTDLFVQRHLVQISIIDKNSGLLHGEYSRTDGLDSDLISGMMTAIKSFVESAFNKEDSELESLDYSEFSIQLFELGSYYFALVFEAKPEENIKKTIVSDIMDFIELNESVFEKTEVDSDSQAIVSAALESWTTTKYKIS